MQGRCSICDMGDVDVCSPCLGRCCSVLKVYEACFSLDLCYCTCSCVHESNKANKTKQEEQT
ncbi:hypothetical protein GW17_00046084 [Ensete ventricosum]|nr:hypothetical protein GW17_00046084 [Ensete ventricosum]